MKALRPLAALLACCLMLGWASPAHAGVRYYDTNVINDKAGDASEPDSYRQSIDIRKVTYAHVFTNDVPYLQARVQMKDVTRPAAEIQAVEFVWWWNTKNGGTESRTLWGYNTGRTDHRRGSAFLKCAPCKAIANPKANTLTVRIPYTRFGKPSSIAGLRVESFRVNGNPAGSWTDGGSDTTRNSGVLY